MTRRVYVTILLSLLLAAALPVTATASPPARYETVEYSVGEGPLGAGRLGGIVASVLLPAGPERFVSIQVRDDSGAAVMAKIVQDDDVENFCGSTPNPVAIRPKFGVTVQLYIGRCLDGTPSVVTSGVIEARFTTTAGFGPGPREHEANYSMTAPGPFVGIDAPLPGNVITGYVVLQVFNERRVRLEIVDRAGGAVQGQVVQGDREIARFCGRTPEPLRITPFENLFVYLHAGSCEDGTPSMPVQGLVKGVFLRGRR